MRITNTSEIPMVYVWRIDNEDRPEDEFDATPHGGALSPGQSQDVEVELTARHVAQYSARLVLDVPHVKSEHTVVPITAECAAPSLRLSAEAVDFGECFLDFPYTRTCVLKNDSPLPAKFSTQPQNKISRSLAEFEVTPNDGSVPGHGVEPRLLALANRAADCKRHVAAPLVEQATR